MDDVAFVEPVSMWHVNAPSDRVFHAVATHFRRRCRRHCLKYIFSKVLQTQSYLSAYRVYRITTEDSPTMQLPDAAVAVIDASLKFVYSFQPLVEKTVVLGTFGGRLWWKSP